MIALGTVTKTKIVKALRVVTAIIFGNSPNDCYESAPFGFDGNPIKGMKAIYAPTSTNNIPVIVGYINQNQIAAIGESRIFSKDADGATQFNIWVRNDGTCLIGTSETPADYVDNLTRYQALKTALDNYFTDLNTAISAGVSSAGGTYTPPVVPFDPSAAKITEIKTQ